MRNYLKLLALRSRVFCDLITYFNPSTAFYAVLWGTRVANEICFILLVNT